MVRTTTPEQIERNLPALPMGIRQAVVVWVGAAGSLWAMIAAATWLLSSIFQ
jgi:hypothetical protein